MTDSSREGGDPPNNVSQTRRKPRPFNARTFAQDLCVVLLVSQEAKEPEARYRLLLTGLRQLVQTHGLFPSSSAR